MSVTEEVFLQLVRLGIGTTAKASLLSQKVNWRELEILAEQQGLSAIIMDGIERLSDDLRPPKELLLQWIGETLQGYEYRFELYRRAISELASFYNSHGYKMMVLKGFACGLDWPKPNHRPCGDIDIWQFGQWKEADSVLTKERKIKIDKSHHQHTIFNWDGFTVENHYDFLNIHAHKTNNELEKVFKELATDDSHSINVDGVKVYMPSPNLHALFLIRHMVAHFASVNITFRQVLDWAFFVKKHTEEIDWNWLLGMLNEYHMKDFFNCINAICVGNLGFDVNIFPYIQFDPNLKDRILNDILKPQFGFEEPQDKLKRLVYKYKRWKGNAWKQELCFPDSRHASFFQGLWSHILKPSSI